MGYRFLDDIAIADVAFEARGSSLEELFSSAATATTEVMVKIEDIEPKIERMISLKNEDLDRLLFSWISELIYLKDSELLIFSKYELKIKSGLVCELEARLFGEVIDPERHELMADVKAATYHQYSLEKRDGEWVMRMVLDI